MGPLINDTNTPRRTLGQWNAYVEAGRDKAQRRARLDEVPTELRDAVASHVRTYFAIQARQRRKKNPHSPYE